MENVRAGAKPRVKDRPGSAAPARRDVKKRERRMKFDGPFFMLILILAVFGLVMLLSASHVYGLRAFGDSFHYFTPQLAFTAAGIVIMVVLSFIPYEIFLKRPVMLMVAFGAVGLMLAASFSPGGVIQGGAQRWLTLPGLPPFQPSEVLKFGLILVLAYIAHKNVNSMQTFKRGFVPYVGIMGFACVLTAIQRHLSATIILAGIGIIMMTCSNIKFKYVLLPVILLLVALYVFVEVLPKMGFNYVPSRILSWQDPEADISNETMQTYQSLITIGSGGLSGLGLGNSRQKYQFLPMTHNDFIFSIVCEELGFFGGMLVILLFVVLVLRGYYIAFHARDRFGMLLAVGITSQIGIQAFLNIGVATNAIPNTGITLPFFSYGGTALLVLYAELGVLLNISRKAAIK